jgi:hypothetical protein
VGRGEVCGGHSVMGVAGLRPSTSSWTT